MKVMDSSKDKVKKICDVLVRETLEPAQKQASEIVDEAHREAEKIIKRGQEKARKLVEEAEAQIREQQSIFESSLKVSTQQVLTGLKDRIENKLFHFELDEQIKQTLSDQTIIVKIIEALIGSLEKEGLTKDSTVIISKQFKPEEICKALIGGALEKLKGQTVQLDSHIEGVRIRSEEKHFSIEVTDAAVKELVTNYAQESLRKILFNA